MHSCRLDLDVNEQFDACTETFHKTMIYGDGIIAEALLFDISASACEHMKTVE